jgi:hypothetical protein
MYGMTSQVVMDITTQPVTHISAANNAKVSHGLTRRRALRDGLIGVEGPNMEVA